jgi:hypothetical protein
MTGSAPAKGLRGAAAHHRQHAIFGAGLAAGHRRVDEFEAAFGRLGVEFTRDVGRSGRARLPRSTTMLPT